MTTLDYDMLAEAAEEAGLDERAIRADYSGRGMYGRTCLGLVCRTTQLSRFHAALLDQLADQVEDQDLDLDLDWFEDYREDAMGLDRIAYWPGVTVEGAPER